jgi:hypothetical protein
MAAAQRRRFSAAGQIRLGFGDDSGHIGAMSNSAEALRRWLGLFCLTVAAGMLIWGQTILKPHLAGMAFIFYWGLCFFFTISAVLIALIDVRAVRQRIKDEHAALIARTLEEIEKEKNKDAEQPKR